MDLKDRTAYLTMMKNCIESCFTTILSMVTVLRYSPRSQSPNGEMGIRFTDFHTPNNKHLTIWRVLRTIITPKMALMKPKHPKLCKPQRNDMSNRVFFQKKWFINVYQINILSMVYLKKIRKLGFTDTSQPQPRKKKKTRLWGSRHHCTDFASQDLNRASFGRPWRMATSKVKISNMYCIYKLYIYIYNHLYIYIYMYLCIYVYIPYI